MDLKRSEGVRGSWAKRGLRKCWRMPSRLMVGRNRFANSVRSQMCGRCGLAADAAQTSRQGCGESTRQAVAARTGAWPTGTSTSSGEEDRKSKSQEAEIKELRALIEHHRKQSGGKAQGRQGPPPRKEVAWRKSGEWMLRMRSRAERSWMSKGKSCRKSLRDVEKLSCVAKEVQDSLKNDLQQQLQEVEQRRHDFMPEHQRVQKISQHIRSIQDKRRKKESTAAKEEMRKIR